MGVKQRIFRWAAFIAAATMGFGMTIVALNHFFIPSTNHTACTLEVGTITGQLESIETRGATYVRYRGADEWYRMLYVGEC